MKHCLLIFLFHFPALHSIHAADPPTLSDLDAKEKHEMLLELINSRKFVLESHTLYGRYGQTAFVSPTTNFVFVDGEAAIIQLALNDQDNGLDGSGSLTLEGKLTKFRIRDRGAGKGVHIRMTFLGATVTDLFMEVSDSSFAIIDLNGIQGERLRMKGELVSLEQSDVLQSIRVY